MKQEIPYKVAVSAAVVIATGREPEKLLIQNIAQHLRLSNPTQRKAFESFLRGFEQPRLLRLVAELRNEAGEAPASAAPPGEVRLLFKSPLPGETQARLAYESFLGGFLLYLQRTRCVCTLQESSAHVTVFIPEGQKLDVEDAWIGMFRMPSHVFFGCDRAIPTAAAYQRECLWFLHLAAFGGTPLRLTRPWGTSPGSVPPQRANAPEDGRM